MSCSCNPNNCGCDSKGIVLPSQITNATFNLSNELVLTFSDGSTITTNALSTECCAEVIHNDLTSETSQHIAYATIGTKTFTVPANTLKLDGDKLKIVSLLKFEKVWDHRVRVMINGNIAFNGPFYVQAPADVMRIEIILSRINNTSMAIDTNVLTMKGKAGSIVDSSINHLNPASLGVLDLTGSTFDIDIQGESDLPAVDITCNQLTVEYIKKD